MAAGLLGAVVVVGADGAMAGGKCGYEWCWGSVAIGPDGRAGRASSMRTAPDAAQRARDVCGEDCSVEVFHNSCGAIARAFDGSWAYGGGDSRQIALDEAVAACEVDGKHCNVVNWACSL